MKIEIEIRFWSTDEPILAVLNIEDQQLSKALGDDISNLSELEIVDRLSNELSFVPIEAVNIVDN